MFPFKKCYSYIKERQNNNKENNFSTHKAEKEEPVNDSYSTSQNFIAVENMLEEKHLENTEDSTSETNTSIVFKAEKEEPVNDSYSTSQNFIAVENMLEEKHLENTEDSTSETNTSIVFKAEKEELVNDSVVDFFIKESQNRYQSIEFIDNYMAVLRDKNGSIIMAGVCEYPTSSTNSENHFRKQLALYLFDSDKEHVALAAYKCQESNSYFLIYTWKFKMQVLCHLAFENYHLFLCINLVYF